MSPAGPDALVEAHGEAVTIERVYDWALDANGQVTDVETDYQTVPIVASDPSEQDVQRADARLGTGALKLTVPSWVGEDDAFGSDAFGSDRFGGRDPGVEGDREGARDRVYRPAREPCGDGTFGDGHFGGRDPDETVFQVGETRDDQHPITGTAKQTALVDELDGCGVSITADH